MAALPKLVIIGAGGFGREMLAWAEQSVQVGRDWEIKGLIDDNLNALLGKNAPRKLLGNIGDYQPASDEVFICAIGVPAIKKECSELIASRGGRFTQLFHRTAVLGHNIEMAEGVAVPFSAVLPTGKQNIVFVDKGEGKLEPRFIELGRKYGDFYEVKSGLKEADRVVASGNFLIDAEAKIQGALKSW